MRNKKSNNSSSSIIINIMMKWKKEELRSQILGWDEICPIPDKSPPTQVLFRSSDYNPSLLESESQRGKEKEKRKTRRKRHIPLVGSGRCVRQSGLVRCHNRSLRIARKLHVETPNRLCSHRSHPFLFFSFFLFFFLWVSLRPQSSCSRSSFPGFRFGLRRQIRSRGSAVVVLREFCLLGG